jgi:fatty aldehyde-generating acyl-ACP reductase
VGAGGDVATGLCRLLHARGIPLLLVGRSPRPLERLAAELAGTHVMALAEALAKAEIIVLAASAPLGAIALDSLRPGARVFDAGHPPNACPVRGIAYAVAGRVSYELPPESDLPVILTDRYPPGETHACLAEGIVLALEGRFESFSSGRGNIRVDRAAEILAVAARHGVRPASLHFKS